MGNEEKMFGVDVKKGTIVLGMGVCSLYLFRYFLSFFLYRFLVLVVKLLASNFPVIFCTSLLLGALLTYGQPNNPDEEEENQTPLVSSERTRNIVNNLGIEKTTNQTLKAHVDGTRINATIDDHKESSRKKKMKVEKGQFPNDQVKEIEGQQVTDHTLLSYPSSDSESSSPNNSKADGMPILDETNLLTGSNASLDILVQQEDSDFLESDVGSVDLAGEVEQADDDEEEAQEKAVIKWTTDDEKNVKDIGSSEVERNQRLESLIVKRKERKRWVIEKNLIDFDDGMLINIPAVSATRQNPFDSPHDLDETTGLPIPGSAPSSLLPRMYPFDLPFDQFEEQGNVVGETPGQQRFKIPQQKEMFFRRYESFTLGASLPRGMKQEKRDYKYRPYFVTEDHDATFQWQLSERSDSKVSCIPEIDRVSASISDMGDHIELLEQDLHQVCEPNSVWRSICERVEIDSQSSRDMDSIEAGLESPNVIDKTSKVYDEIGKPPRFDANSFNGMKVSNGSGGEEVGNNGVAHKRNSMVLETRGKMLRGDSPVIRRILHQGRNAEEDMESNDEAMWVAPPNLSGVDEHESRSMGVREITEHDVIHVGLRPRVIRPASENRTSNVSKLVEDGMGDEKATDQDLHILDAQRQL